MFQFLASFPFTPSNKTHLSMCLYFKNTAIKNTDLHNEKNSIIQKFALPNPIWFCFIFFLILHKSRRCSMFSINPSCFQSRNSSYFVGRERKKKSIALSFRANVCQLSTHISRNFGNLWLWRLCLL